MARRLGGSGDQPEGNDQDDPSSGRRRPLGRYYGWQRLVIPVHACARRIVMIMVVALLVNNAVKERGYPTFWW